MYRPAEGPYWSTQESPVSALDRDKLGSYEPMPEWYRVRLNQGANECICGQYEMHNTETTESYIGQSISMKSRTLSHYRQAATYAKETNPDSIRPTGSSWTF